MSPDEFRKILREEVGRLLDDMRTTGFWFGPSNARYLRFDNPTTWDINCGRCEDFAEAVAVRAPDADVEEPCIPELHQWTDDDGEVYCAHDHVAVRWNDLWYDAECLDGVEDPRDLPIYRNRGRTRDDVLAERGEGCPEDAAPPQASTGAQA